MYFVKITNCNSKVKVESRADVTKTRRMCTKQPQTVRSGDL
jgi:hypothetical protein